MAGIFDPGIFDSGIFDDAGATARTTTDAPTTSDAVTRTLVASRTVTAAPTTSDVATRAQVLFRSATEAISTADVAARAVILARAATDAPTTADAVTRTAVLSRIDSESITASDAAVIASVARTTSDAPTTSDAATRALTASRAASDAPTIAGTVTRSAALTRTTSDAPTTSDAARASFIRTATEAISTADVATRVRNVGRSTTEAVSATVAATRAVVLSRNVTQALTGADVALSVPVPYLPGPVIYIDGVNITKADGDPVVFSTARFMSAVNGVAGEAHFRVRDDLGTTNYVPGQPLSLVIDGQATWTGFITNVKRVYAFSALNVDDFGPTRFFDIDGTDLNILFSRRIVFNAAHPENVLAPLYSFYTPDVTAISDLLAGWLDLSGDALDTSTDVHHVGAINADQLARAWEGSDTWGQAMQSITALPASIYYIRPNRLFAYVDTDTPDAPFGLSDVPNGTTSKGYREMEVLFDGTNLANDVLAWGVGYGSTSPVFTRAEDATSQSEHGLWQTGQTAFGIYKQATIDRVADSILNGSPDHHRGAKDDRHAVTITTYEPGLLPAQKLLFESNVFGYSEVLPIRKMEITFPTPTTPKYELTLSQEIDVPWSFFDVFRLPGFGFTLPGFTLPPFPPIVIPGGCQCSVTQLVDDFNNRVTSIGSNDWGTSSDGHPYVFIPVGIGSPPATGSYYVAGGEGHSTREGHFGLSDGQWLADELLSAGQFSMTGTFTVDQIPNGTNQQVYFAFFLDFYEAQTGSDFPTGLVSSVAIKLTSTNGLGDTVSIFNEVGSTSASFLKDDWGIATTYHYRVTRSDSELMLRIWAGTEPDTWDLTIAADPHSIGGVLIRSFIDRVSPGSTPAIVGSWDNIEITYDACDQARYDDFDRIVSGAWGGGWTTDFAPGATPGVNGTGFAILSAAGANAQFAGVAASAAYSTMVFRFLVTAVATGSDLTIIEVFADNPDVLIIINNNTSGGIQCFGNAGSASFSKTDWVANTWYIAKIDASATVVQAKVYVDGATEPAYQTVADNTGGSGWTGPLKMAFIKTAGIGVTAEIDWIDFDYTGKPCFQDCGSTLTFDDFARTDSGTWGNSTYGTAWNENFTPNPPGAIDVSGGQGLINLSNFASSPYFRSVQTSVISVSPLSGGFTLRSSFTFDTTFTGDETLIVGFTAIDSANQPTNNVFAYVEMSSNPSHTFLSAGSAPDGISIPTAPSIGTTINFAWSVSSSEWKAKVWWSGSEPDWMVTSSGAVHSWDILRVTADGSDWSPDFWGGQVGINPIVFEACTDVLPTTGGALFSPQCEVAVRVDSTHYQLSLAVAPGTDTVYEGTPGFLLLPGIARDYTIDIAAGLITLTDAVADGTRIYCCYTAAGPVS